MPRLTGLDRNKPEIQKKRYLKRAIQLGFKKSCAHIFQFPVPHARFPLSALRFKSEFTLIQSSLRLFQLTYRHFNANFPGVEFAVYVFPLREISHFHVVVMLRRCTKKCDARAELLFC